MGQTVFPYIPNSAPGKKEELLKEIGLSSVEDIFKEIPDHLRYKKELKIPSPFLSEFELKKHVEGILNKNTSTGENLSFLGGGAWQHYVPAVCSTIASRDEFLTAYQREAYADHGKFQALFEASSMLGDLLEMDAVAPPTYDWANAAAIACRMAGRITEREEILVPGSMRQERLAIMRNYCSPDLIIRTIAFHSSTGQLDQEDLKEKLSPKTAAIYIENPSYLGFIEREGEAIGALAKENGSEMIVGVDPSSLGVLAPPSSYGATMACGDIQPFGLGLQWGGGLAGFIASPDEERYIEQYPTLLYGITKTVKEGQYGYGRVAFERTSYAVREKGRDFVGTSASLYGIVSGVYLALMGPQGLRELGEGIMQRTAYAREALSSIPSVNAKAIDALSFKEFVVTFDHHLTVKKIHKALLEKGVFGGWDLGEEFPQYSNSALYAITEVHTKEDIDRLVEALKEILNEKGVAER